MLLYTTIWVYQSTKLQIKIKAVSMTQIIIKLFNVYFKLNVI